jgi:hypothetical protein
MQFEDFAFGSLRIDGRTYSIMSSLTAGRSANARKSRPRNFATSLVARPCQLGRRFPGSAADLSSPGRRQPVMKEVQHEAAQSQIAGAPNDPSHGGLEASPRRHQRDSPRDLLGRRLRPKL